MSNLLEKAISLANKVHSGQVDKAGKPYILHPLRLMFQFSTGEEMIVAVLHDVVEDGNVTLEQLYEQGFTQPIVEAIDSLSRRKDESYDAFIDRVKTNSLSTRVKIADLKDNLNATRLEFITEKDFARLAKYHRALKSLSS